MRKLYCYIDETGLDPRSTFFLVSVVIVEADREQIEPELVQIEKESSKGRRKWMETREVQRISYIQKVLSLPALKGRLFFATYPPAKDYFTKTVATTASAITHYTTEDDYRATILIDGLPKTLIPRVGSALRHMQIRTLKVRGVRKEESDAFMRLADAICGFVRAAMEGKEGHAKLLERAKDQEYIREL